MKNIYQNKNREFPLFCSRGNSDKPFLFIDMENGEVWADSESERLMSEKVWNGSVLRVKIDGNFISDSDVIDFINDQEKLIDEILKEGEHSLITEADLYKIQENSWRYNEDNLICESIYDYQEFCNLSDNDLKNELKDYAYDVNEYVDDLLSVPNGCIYFTNTTKEDLIAELKEILNADYTYIWCDDSGTWHPSLRGIADDNWDKLYEADEKEVNNIFFVNERSIDTDEIYNQIQKVKNNESDVDEFLESLDL